MVQRILRKDPKPLTIDPEPCMLLGICPDGLDEEVVVVLSADSLRALLLLLLLVCIGLFALALVLRFLVFVVGRCSFCMLRRALLAIRRVCRLLLLGSLLFALLGLLLDICGRFVFVRFVYRLSRFGAVADLPVDQSFEDDELQL